MKYYCDLHIHSALSPCGDKDMTPNNIVNMAQLCGLDIIALCDHNSTGNVRATIKASKDSPLLVVAGMELETAENVHFVCLFENIDVAEEFDLWLAPFKPTIKNKPEIFGEQCYLDESDNVTGFEEMLLVNACNISIYDVKKKIDTLPAVIIPAHIDRSSYSIISNLGTIDSSFNFNCAEIADIDTLDTLKKQHPYLNELKILSGSDAHYLEHMRLKEHYIEPEENSIEAILEYLKKPC